MFACGSPTCFLVGKEIFEVLDYCFIAGARLGIVTGAHLFLWGAADMSVAG